MKRFVPVGVFCRGIITPSPLLAVCRYLLEHVHIPTLVDILLRSKIIEPLIPPSDVRYGVYYGKYLGVIPAVIFIGGNG